MSENTTIPWCHHTFNPVMGCAKVHTGCTNCYAETHQAVSMRQGGKIRWGEPWQGGQRVVVADSTWAHPLTWSRKAAKAGERHRVFCASLADVLETPEMPPFQHLTTERRERENAAKRTLDGARERLWDTIRKTAAMILEPSGLTLSWKPHPRPILAAPGTPGLDWLLLTKRPENWRLVPEDVRPLAWLGTSISDQETADEWVPRLLAAEGFRYRFLSVEPLVGPVDLSGFFGGAYAGLPGDVVHDNYNFGISWVIVGGESGSKARPCGVEWVRSIVRQCAEAGIPCFVKQLGAVPVWPSAESVPDDLWSTWDASDAGAPAHYPVTGGLADPKGGDMAEWPEDLRVRQFPGVAP